MSFSFRFSPGSLLQLVDRRSSVSSSPAAPSEFCAMTASFFCSRRLKTCSSASWLRLSRLTWSSLWRFHAAWTPLYSPINTNGTRTRIRRRARVHELNAKDTERSMTAAESPTVSVKEDISGADSYLRGLGAVRTVACLERKAKELTHIVHLLVKCHPRRLVDLDVVHAEEGGEKAER